MTPDRAINDLGTIKYLLDATEFPQKFLTDAHESAFLYSSSPTILSMEFITNWFEIFSIKNAAELTENFLREETTGAFSPWCFTYLV